MMGYTDTLLYKDVYNFVDIAESISNSYIPMSGRGDNFAWFGFDWYPSTGNYELVLGRLRGTFISLDQTILTYDPYDTYDIDELTTKLMLDLTNYHNCVFPNDPIDNTTIKSFHSEYVITSRASIVLYGQ